VEVLFSSAPEPGLVVESAGSWLPLALVHLAGVARAAGHRCTVVDALTERLSISEVERIVHLREPDVVCVTAATPGFPAALDLCRRVRAPGRITVVGGAHASFMYSEFLPEGAVDFAVVGEGEETLPELLDCLALGGDPARVPGVAFALGGRVVRTAPRPRLAALDPLPKAWDLLQPERYRWAPRPGSRMAAIVTSRGCPRRCASCAEAALYEGTWRRRSVDSIAYELATLRRDHGVDVVAFHDAAPAADGPRFAALVDRIIELELGLDLVLWACVPDILRDASRLCRWREAGVTHVGICRDPSEDRLAGADGVRAVADGARAVEALRVAGITSEAPFWIGFPDETPLHVDETFSRALAWSPDVASFPLLTPLPYTAAWRTYGAHVVTRDWRRFNQREPVVKPRAMDLAEVSAAAEGCRRRFNAARAAGAGPRVAVRHAGPWEVHPVEPAAQAPAGTGQDGVPAVPGADAPGNGASDPLRH
jgi:anaerobic magnesium-protoporphyrin IX monomethyl ester cyclase